MFKGLTALLLLLVSPRVLAHEGGALPDDLWTHWNTNPLLLFGLLLPLHLYLRGAATYRIARWRTFAFVGGLTLLLVALISPLDSLSGALFSAHMVQHLLLVLGAAPLLALSKPLPPLLRAIPHQWRKTLGNAGQFPAVTRVWHKLSHPITASLLHIAALWIWHLPALYSGAVDNPGLHILEHLSFFGTAVLWWWMILHTPDYGTRILSVFIVMMTSGLLGALMTFARTAWYTDHTALVDAWGLTLLEDQQLAGLFMWIPVSLLYMTVAAALLGAWINAAEHKVMTRERQLIKEMSDA